MKKKYQTEEERKAAHIESVKRWQQANREKVAKQKSEYYQNNKENIAAQKAEWYQANKEKIAKQKIEYRSTPKGRANGLLKDYKKADKKYNRGECTLTADWIVEHIFTQPCAHCGKTEWRELGCNRLNNSLPHTPDNVEPCCTECNKKLPRK